MHTIINQNFDVFHYPIKLCPSKDLISLISQTLNTSIPNIGKTILGGHM